MLLLGPPEDNQVPPVIGTIIGGVVAIIVFILAIVIYTCYSQRTNQSSNNEAKELSPSVQYKEVYVKSSPYSAGKQSKSDVSDSRELLHTTGK